MTECTPLKRFILLEATCYDGTQGWDAFTSSHDTLEEAFTARDTEWHAPPMWWQIVDCNTQEIVIEHGGYGEEPKL